MRRLVTCWLALTLGGCAVTMQHHAEERCDTTRAWAYLDAAGVAIDAVVFGLVHGEDRVLAGVDGAATLGSAVLGWTWANECRQRRPRPRPSAASTSGRSSSPSSGA